MKAGRLDDRITIEEFSITQDEFGNIVEEWVELATVWADVFTQKAEDTYSAAQNLEIRTLRFQIRYRDDLTRSSHRVIWNGDTYDIYDLDESRRRDGVLWITATEET